MNLRYEEYTDTPGQAPFVLNRNIQRTAALRSKNQNWHENIEIQFCKEGEGFVLIDGKCHAFSKGDIALIDSGAIHYTFTDTNMVYTCIIISTYFCKQMGIDYQRLSFVPLLQNEKLSGLFEEICDVYRKESPIRVARLSNLLLSMLILIVDDYSSIKSSSGMEQKELATVKKVLLYIRENYHTKITLDAIAEHVLTDKYTLCKIFKANTGQTIFENINAYRCMRAAEYIASGKNVCESANLCGFENNSFFKPNYRLHMTIIHAFL
jgi:AraC-like DNA-binding protein